ncbi:Polysaccharide biosynthesis/export protein [Caballeronia sp. SBC1]|uniref:polysaccharide biosynthesis/export family protein n=1 Tax=unclassified Caballeronia TaxID=2646786 RepID=UPI0013E1E2D2|nr:MULTISPECIES: polysaccharide biosynthesis/export family protein [unclassified Caballeronia]QIE24126.1 Polysaccharide biosynthesis/export protein [Caballeronia sp. SBC2]QIN62022.1 Polysaccharide biosynthesis/export protein [Caballeronia sp. SBC1]
MNIKLLVSLLAGATFTASLTGCAIAPGPYLDTDRLDQTPSPESVAQANVKYHVQPIDVSYFETHPRMSDSKLESVCPLTCLTRDTRKLYAYHIGVNDQVSVTVWDHPEFSSAGISASTGAAGVPPLPSAAPGGTAAGGAPVGAPGATGGTSGPEAGGVTVRVANDGTIFFPRVGRVQAVGKTAQELQETLTKGLSKTIRNPQLDVRITGFYSKQVQVTGDLKQPSSQPITDVPLSVIDAINRSGGANPDADLQNVGITRNGHRYAVDVAALLDRGDIQQNVLLQDDDIIDVPDRTKSRVFLFGELAKPQTVPMNRGHLTLADALANANSIDPHSADPRMIYVIRGSDQQFAKGGMLKTSAITPADGSLAPAARPLDLSVYKLDMTQVDALMLMTQFDLHPRDVIYVQVASAARFNRVLEQIAPTIQTLFYTIQTTR